MLASKLSRLRSLLSTSRFRGLRALIPRFSPFFTAAGYLLGTGATLQDRCIVGAGDSSFGTVAARDLLICECQCWSEAVIGVPQRALRLRPAGVSYQSHGPRLKKSHIHLSQARGTQERGALPLDGSCEAGAARALSAILSEADEEGDTVKGRSTATGGQSGKKRCRVVWKRSRPADGVGLMRVDALHERGDNQEQRDTRRGDKMRGVVESRRSGVCVVCAVRCTERTGVVRRYECRCRCRRRRRSEEQGAQDRSSREG